MKKSLFNEIYGGYFSSIQHILKEAAGKDLTDKELLDLVKRIAKRYAFADSAVFIYDAILDGQKALEEDELKDAWPFFERIDTGAAKGKTNAPDHINRSTIRGVDIPLSTLEKRWLNAICHDPRIQLFTDTLPRFDSVEALFKYEDYILFDQFSDGDPFLDEHYKAIFKKVLTFVHSKTRMIIECMARNNNTAQKPSYDTEKTITHILDPECIEYSERDDKFRLIGNSPQYGYTIVNLSSVIACEEYIGEEPINRNQEIPLTENYKKEVILEVINNKNVLERMLTHFSHYEKEAYSVEGDRKFHVKILYSETDESDIIIRILSFGHHIKVLEPESIRDLIVERINKQLQLLTER